MSMGNGIGDGVVVGGWGCCGDWVSWGSNSGRLNKERY